MVVVVYIVEVTFGVGMPRRLQADDKIGPVRRAKTLGVAQMMAEMARLSARCGKVMHRVGSADVTTVLQRVSGWTMVAQELELFTW